MTVWRNDPNFEGKFHPEYPDDLQVIMHDGSFRFTNTRPEVMWVRIIAKMEAKMESGETLNYCKGVLLNAPHQLKTVKLQQQIYLVAYKDYQYAIYVTPDYLKDRLNWEITPCTKCGLPEAFDPIPKLWKKSFPDTPDSLNTSEEKLIKVFSSFCPLCGQEGFLMIKEKGFDESDDTQEGDD